MVYQDRHDEVWSQQASVSVSTELCGELTILELLLLRGQPYYNSFTMEYRKIYIKLPSLETKMGLFLYSFSLRGLVKCIYLHHSRRIQYYLFLRAL